MFVLQNSRIQKATPMEQMCVESSYKNDCVELNESERMKYIVFNQTWYSFGRNVLTCAKTQQIKIQKVYKQSPVHFENCKINK